MVSNFISRFSGKHSLQRVTRFFTLAIIAALVWSLVGLAKPAAATNTPFITTSCCDIVWKTAFSKQLSASGGSGTGYTYAVTGGTLPFAMTLTSGGLLSGTTLSRGPYSFTVTVTDSLGATGSATFSGTILGIYVYISPATFPSAQTGVVTYHIPLTVNVANGGVTAPVNFTSPNLPAWLTLTNAPNGTEASLSGTGVTGTYTFTVNATDAYGYTGTVTYTVTVPTTISPSDLNTNGIVYVGTAINPVQFTTGDGGPDTFTVSGGSLAPGLNLSSTGLYSGTPTQNGTFVFYITTVNTNTGLTSIFKEVQQVNLLPNLRIIATPNATSSSPLSVAANGAISVTLSISNLSGQATAPFTWTIPGGVEGSLPTGLTLTPGSTSATLTGSIATTGTYTFKVVATDQKGLVGNITVVIVVS